MLNIVKLAWRNIGRNRRRTAITAVTITVAVAILVIFNGVINGLLERTISNNVELETGHIKIYSEDYYEKSDLMPIEMQISNYEQVISDTEKVDGVEHTAPRIKAGGILNVNQNSSRVIINGIEPEADLKLRDLKKYIKQGKYLSDSDTDSIIIGKSLAEILKTSLDDEILLNSIAIDGAPVSETIKIKAIFETGFPFYDKSMVFIPLSHVQKILKFEDDRVTEIVVTVSQLEEAKNIANTLAAELNYDILDWEELEPDLAQFVEMERSAFSFFGILILVIATVGILNTMSMAVYERTKEIGILAALGYKRRGILLSFLLEGFMIGIIGAAAGCILGTGITQYLSIVGITFGGAQVVEFMEATIYPTLSLYNVLSPFFLAIGITLLAALYPAYRASKMEPVEALKHV